VFEEQAASRVLQDSSPSILRNQAVWYAVWAHIRFLVLLLAITVLLARMPTLRSPETVRFVHLDSAALKGHDCVTPARQVNTQIEKVCQHVTSVQWVNIVIKAGPACVPNAQWIFTRTEADKRRALNALQTKKQQLYLEAHP
jgi:hypothetical protein